MLAEGSSVKTNDRRTKMKRFPRSCPSIPWREHRSRPDRASPAIQRRFRRPPAPTAWNPNRGARVAMRRLRSVPARAPTPAFDALPKLCEFHRRPREWFDPVQCADRAARGRKTPTTGSGSAWPNRRADASCRLVEQESRRWPREFPASLQPRDRPTASDRSIRPANGRNKNGRTTCSQSCFTPLASSQSATAGWRINAARSLNRRCSR